MLPQMYLSRTWPSEGNTHKLSSRNRWRSRRQKNTSLLCKKPSRNDWCARQLFSLKSCAIVLVWQNLNYSPTLFFFVALQAAIIKAEGESESAQLISDATKQYGSAMIEVRRIEVSSPIRAPSWFLRSSSDRHWITHRPPRISLQPYLVPGTWLICHPATKCFWMCQCDTCINGSLREYSIRHGVDCRSVSTLINENYIHVLGGRIPLLFEYVKYFWEINSCSCIYCANCTLVIR